MSTQRQITAPQALPRCQHGHSARLMLDARRRSSGGGYFVECACSSSSKQIELIDAEREWCRMHGHPMPPGTDQRPLPLAVVTPIRAVAERAA